MAVIDGEILCIYDAISPQKIITSFQNYATPRSCMQPPPSFKIRSNSSELMSVSFGLPKHFLMCAQILTWNLTNFKESNGPVEKMGLSSNILKFNCHIDERVEKMSL